MIDHQPIQITKSQYRQYLACKHEFWLQWHDPENYTCHPDPEMLHQVEMGNAIERLAVDYFLPSDELMVDFQQELVSGQLFARADVILTDLTDNTRTLVEIKSGAAVTKEYIDDLAFQFIAAEATGITVDRVGVLHINKQYIYNGVLDLRQWLVYEDITEQMSERLEQTRLYITAALKCLKGAEPEMSLHGFCHKKRNCPAYQKHHPSWASYSVFQISGIHPVQLKALLKLPVTDIKAVPDDFELPPKLRLQVKVARTGNPYINSRNINTALEELRFPLYFLDYEALQYGIPLYTGTRPYQQMVFQWSLHILDNPESELRHLEFLADGIDHPAHAFIHALYAAIPADGGSVVVWNKDFETRRNNELALMFPEFGPFMTDLNARVFDLMEIFRKQYFVHPASGGSYSIKRILPVLAPHLSYGDLQVSGGLMASIRWFDMISGKIPPHGRAQVMDDLRAYCGLDTLGMVEIYRALIGRSEG